MFSLRNCINITKKLCYLNGNTSEQVRHAKRWVAPTRKELMKRRRKMGPEAIKPRSTFIEWNYNAELYAFGKRLHENFNLKNLQTAFTHRSYIIQEEIKQRNVGIDQPIINLDDNKKFIQKGEELISGYVYGFLKYSLPNLPEDGIKAIYNYLTNEEMLAHISLNLGTKDLALCGEFPISQGTLRDTLVAVIGALADSSGDIQTYTFIRDFICTQLNQKDLMEILDMGVPFQHLQNFCKEKNLGEPEPRIIGDVAKNTVLAAYNVGIYCNKKQIGSGFGESVHVAIDMAAVDALRSFYGINDNLKPFNFSIELDKLDKKVLKLS